MPVNERSSSMVEEWDEVKHIASDVRTTCSACGNRLSSPLLDLPDLPLTEMYSAQQVHEKIGFVDQAFHFCTVCGHGLLAHVLDPQVVYGSQYTFRSSTSHTAIKALDMFNTFICRVVRDRTFDIVVEIGCSDLNLLKKLRGRASRLIGIDPIFAHESYPDTDFTLIGDLVEHVNVHDITEGTDCLVVSSHTLEHLSDPRALIEKLLHETSDNTIFCFQFPGLEYLVADWRFDQIFHQHLNYFSLRSLTHMLENLGGELIAYDVNPHHWGTLLVAFKKRSHTKNEPRFRASSFQKLQEEEILKNYSGFRLTMDSVSTRLTSFRDSKRVGYGASLMLPILSYYLQNDLSCLDCIMDDDPQKDGQFYVNLPVPIQHSSHVASLEDTVCLLTSVASRANVRPMMKKLFDRHVREVIVPLSSV